MMTKFTDITFTMTDVIKLVAILALIIPMWIDLRTDKVKINYKIDLLQYQVDEIKKNLCLINKK